MLILTVKYWHSWMVHFLHTKLIAEKRSTVHLAWNAGVIINSALLPLIHENVNQPHLLKIHGESTNEKKERLKNVQIASLRNSYTIVWRECEELVRLRPQLIANCGSRGGSSSNESSIFPIDERSNVHCSQYKSIKIMFNNIYGLRRHTSVYVCGCCC